MTPVEKARALMQNYIDVQKQIDWSTYDNTHVLCYYIGDTEEKYWHKLAKQCALIAVDEILKITWVDKFLSVEDYWNEVKIEIEKL